ncbi:SSI family serine proteinase inhibitor [Streptomyces sp. NBC_01283]|uniref:SSI family serine proteinase inhibitor n=1 Tax=Streptomyces sp. NBC_01283 TaxID=2903812 RepID=UPI00352DE920|nr:SSI family serine proteinase inhibitor [Streptomyces sp. NBC_01283]
MRSRPTSRLRPAAAVAAALVSLVVAAPAHAAHETAPERGSGVFLTVTGQDNAWVRGVLLDCVTRRPAHHPHAAEACAAIDAAHGDFDALPAKQGICTKQYAPVTVSATGHHRGKPVSWNKTYGNACEMGYSTGAVFRF